MKVQSWPHVASFYADDERRRLSTETDFGVLWREGPNQATTYRISHVDDTRELYAVRLTTDVGGEPVGELSLLAEDVTVEEVELMLEGWEDVCGTGDSYEWARSRLA